MTAGAEQNKQQDWTFQGFAPEFDAHVREQLPGGAIIVVDKEESPGGYPATVLSRLTWDCKLRQGAEPGAVMRKELSLSGVQRPLYKGELGADAVEVFRFGDFAGWLIEG